MHTVAIARAHGGRPLRRLVIGGGPRVYYLLNPVFADDPIRFAAGGIGFPRSDCFVWDTEAYERLTEIFERTGETASEDWQLLSRLGVHVIA